MNEGLTRDELAARIELPEHLGGQKPWGRQYYGSVKHSVRNVYGGYEGWFQGDPVALDPTPPAEYAKRVVNLMGGRDKVLAEAKRALAGGDAQFAAELATDLVRIDTKDTEARHVKASAFRKLGYAQMNASWRNYYLVSAMELDDQIPSAIYLHEAGKMLGTAMRGLPARGQMALLPVRLKAEETLAEDVVAAVHYGDENVDFALHLRHGVLEIAARKANAPAFGLEVTRTSMGTVLGGAPFSDQVDGGAIKISGDAALARKFFSWFEVPFTKKPEVVVR
jgi:alkyl sulfatase BDS1-like metallo-beta-lactamase superfamily hydrolase